MTKVERFNAHRNVRFTEDLQHLAASAFDLSGRLCGNCRDLHAVWPFLRLARASTRVKNGKSVLDQVLAELIGEGRQRVLVGGARDSGILALVARAAADRKIDISVIDICMTPLELCRRFAERWSLQIETACEDLAHLEREREFDIVLIDGTLSYLPQHQHEQALHCIAHSLRQNGRLVLLFKTGEPLPGALAAQHSEGYSRWLIGELNRVRVPLPEPDDVFAARLRADTQGRMARDCAFTSPEQVDALLQSAGFTIQTRREIRVDLVDPMQRPIPKIDQRRYLTIASFKPDALTTGAPAREI